MSDFQITHQILLLRKNFTLLKYLSEFLIQFDFTKIFSRKIREKYVNYYYSRIIRELFAKNLIYNIIQKFN